MICWVMVQAATQNRSISQAQRVGVVRSTSHMVLTPEQKRRIAHLPLKPVEFKR